jgi:uncharacterized protein
MPSPADTLIDVRALIDKPGATRSLDRHVALPSGLDDELVEAGPHVAVQVIIERVVDGLLVRGTVSAPAQVSCARCLGRREVGLRADVVEMFTTPTDADADAEPGYDIVDTTIDLDTMLRDALATVMPARPLCRPDCAGLCPVCGADRNVAPCDGHPEEHDQRWAALSELHLPDTH